MSQTDQDSKLAVFARVAAWHFANQPATWCITRRTSSWRVSARRHLHQHAPHQTRGSRQPHRRTLRQGALRRHRLVPRLPPRPASTHRC